MKKSYYLFNPGRMSRKDNTLKFQPVDEHGVEGTPRYLPVENIEELFCLGSLDMNSALLNFLGREGIHIHFFDYYENYTGSFAPREYLLAGKMQVEQVKAHLDAKKRQYLAAKVLEGGVANMIRNLKYYQGRGKDVKAALVALDEFYPMLSQAGSIEALMGLEGNCRKSYYSAFDAIIDDFTMGNREKQPPSNEVNALISFGNMLCYSLCLRQIYRTQLNPTISFLHQPGVRRFSLALDIAEVFKPFLIDRVIFRVLNKKEIQAKHFERRLNGCYLNQAGKQIILKAYEEKLNETIKHRSLGRSVSYQHLVRLECYKIAKYILGLDEKYKPFKIRW